MWPKTFAVCVDGDCVTISHKEKVLTIDLSVVRKHKLHWSNSKVLHRVIKCESIKLTLEECQKLAEVSKL